MIEWGGLESRTGHLGLGPRVRVSYLQSGNTPGSRAVSLRVILIDDFSITLFLTTLLLLSANDSNDTATNTTGATSSLTALRHSLFHR